MKLDQLKYLICILLFININNALLGNDDISYITEVTHYGVKEGLSHRTIRDIHEDHRGFVWLATKYGLNRFDGKNFQWFTKEKQGLPSNYIRSIYEDKEGWLWIFSDDDTKAWTDFTHPSQITLINIYSLEVRSIEEHLSAPLPFKMSNFLKMAFTKDDEPIFMTIQKAFYIYNAQDEFRKVDCPTLINPFILTDKNTILGITPNYTYVEVDLLGKVLREHSFPEQLPTIFPKDTRIIQNFKYKNEYLLYGYSKNLEYPIFTTSDREPLPYFELPKGIKISRKNFQSNIFFDAKRQRFWYYDEGKLLVFSLRDGLIYNFSDKYPQLTENTVYDIIFSNNVTWVATSDGLFKIELAPNPFSSYLKINMDEYAIDNLYSCRGILQVGDTLYVNVTNGKAPHLIDLKTGNSTKIIINETGEFFFPKGVFQDKIGDIWFGVDNVLKKDKKTGRFKLYYETAPYLRAIWTIYQDQNGTMWFGGSEGIGFFDENRAIVEKKVTSKPYESLNKETVYRFLEISPTKVLLATTNGIYEFNPLKKKITNRYWTKGKDENYFPYDNIHHIYRDKKGIVWVATGGGGVIRWEQKGDKNFYQQFTIADGLSSNGIHAVYEDKENNLWMSSDYGIMRFNKITFNTKAYLPEDGVNQEEFNRISHYQALDGRLYFGGLNGVTAFYPEDITDTSATTNIPLEIIELLQYSSSSNKMVNQTAKVLQSSTITLNPGDRFFDLKFALLNYENSSLIRYAYRIEGMDTDWKYISENNIRISGLPHGKYQLTIRGQSPNGQYSANKIQLTIRVIRPIYLRWWFILLVSIVLIGGVYYWFKWRTRQLKNRQIELENQVQERTQQIQNDKQVIEKQAAELKNLDTLKSNFFANISHELRTPLTLMLAPIDSALKENSLNKRGTTFLQIAKENGKQLLKLINSILDLSKLEANKLDLHPESIAFYPLTRRIISTFESYAQSQGIRLFFNYQAEETLRLQLDVSKFEIIINNLLSNAIKFTPPKGKVEIVISDKSNHIEIIVKDTGRGIHPNDLPYVFNRFYQSKQANITAEGGTGIGLALCKELVQLFKGRISVESELGKGTTFLLNFPRIEAFDTMTPTPETDLIPKEIELHFEDEKLSVGIDNVKIKNRKILLVEDNPTLRNFLKLLLNHHEVTTAGNGQEALDTLKILNPDLIISDVMMPIMDGFQLLEQLKSNGKYRHIPILMLTARASMSDKLKALRIGVDDYMTKPFEQDELYARVDNLLKNVAERSKWIEEVESELDNIEPEKITITISDADKEWLETLEVLVEENIAVSSFNTNAMADELFMSRSQLFRRLKKITGLSPSQYLQEVRLKKAFELFENQTYSTVKAVASSVGFTHRNSFAAQFKERFGKLPSECL